MPGPGIRGFRKMRFRQPSMQGFAAEAARGSSSSSQVAPSPAQRRSGTDREVEDRCPICLDSWREPSFVMPCLHNFCYGCIRRWARNKAQCPLCKGNMTSILHSVRADDDFEEDVIIPPETPPEVPPAGSAPRDPDAPNVQRPEAQQQWATEGENQHFMGGFHLPNWMSYFSANSALHQTLHSWFCQSLEMLFETVASRIHYTRAPQQQQRCREHRHRHHPRQLDTRGTTGQEDSSSSRTPAPASSNVDEMPSTSSSATGWAPSARPSASTTTRVEQEAQQERERLFPGPPNFVRGGDPSLRGPQRPRKRRASSPIGSPTHRRPRY